MIQQAGAVYDIKFSISRQISCIIFYKRQVRKVQIRLNVVTFFYVLCSGLDACRLKAHPGKFNCVAAFQAAEIHDRPTRYIVTEYFPSGSLELRIRNLMTVKDSIDIFLQIAGALVVVHSAGLCHRDLKPANVMMRQDGRIVLIDFGLAKRLDSGITSAGEVRGSPYYISPEQAEGAAVDPRSDLYSLGVMLYEMLTGTRPFRGSTVISIIQAHRNDPIPVLPAELSQFQRLLDALLAKDPRDRFPSAVTAIAELARMKV